MGYAGAAIGAVMGGLKSASKGTGKNQVESLVKNPRIQGYLDTSLGDYGATKTASAASLDDYIKNFLAGNATATARAGEEQGAVDRYYNGDVERALAELRTKHAAASQEALDRSLRYATHARNLDQIVGGGGGGSSYDRQLALKTGADLNLGTLLQNIQQQRADEEYLRQSQLGLAGRRTAIADADLARRLVPAGMQKAELGWNLGTLGNLLQLDQANKFYGVKYKPSGFERGVDIAGGVLGGASSGFMGDISGGDGGQGASPGGTNWGIMAPNNYATPGAPGYVTRLPTAAPSGSPPYAASGWQMPAFGDMYSSIPLGSNFAAWP